MDEVFNNQLDMLLDHLTKYGQITDNEARDFYAIHRLPARVAELRALGYEIETDWGQGKNRFGKKCRWAIYRMKR